MSNARYKPRKMCDWCNRREVAVYTCMEIGTKYSMDGSAKGAVKDEDLLSCVADLCGDCRARLISLVTDAAWTASNWGERKA